MSIGFSGKYEAFPREREDKFWGNVRIDTSSSCWNWTGNLTNKGYGLFNFKQHGKTINFIAHRLAKAIWPDTKFERDLVLMHKCDNPKCCNPYHLSFGTQQDNANDMKAKGRSAFGNKHKSVTQPHSVLRGDRVGNSKLTPDVVRAIRSEYIKGTPNVPSQHSLTGLANKYGIAFQTVSKIINHKSWSHV